MKQGKWLNCLIVIVGVACLGLGAGAGAKANAAEGVFACAEQAEITKEITPQAQLEEFSCFIKKWKGAKVLHFKVAVKNVSNEPQRFKIRIFLDNGKAVGGLLPRKTKKGLIKPGQTAKFVYPVKGMAAKPGSIILHITTMGQ